MFQRLGALALSSVILCGNSLLGADAKTYHAASFGTLRSPAPDAARTQALDWLKTTGKATPEALKAFEVIWTEDRPLADKVADTLCLGNADAAKLLAEARDPKISAPTEVPALLLETKSKDIYFRSNLALAYAKALSNRRVYEEALETFRTIKPEQVVDPAALLFHKAVAEYAMMQQKDAEDSIVRLLDDVVDSPERYKMVAALMHFDMLSWKGKDLGWIARKMDNIERRLDLSRGGPTTQKMQKEVVMRLDELIKEKENQKKSQSNAGNCPNGGQNPGGKPNNSVRPTSPQNDSNGGNGTGPGLVDQKKIKELAEQWGKLPEKERAQALLDLTRDMPPRYREVIESYFKKINPDAGK